VVTPSHRLAERGISRIVHAVGPIWDDERPEMWTEYDRLLASAYRTALQVAEQVGARSIAFPSISTGIFGFPKARAAAIAVREATTHVGNLERIVLTAFDTESLDIVSAALASVR
jgi:O-acetyl-ADP-ribose deacetylase (regulator of RNase III)